MAPAVACHVTSAYGDHAVSINGTVDPPMRQRKRGGAGSNPHAQDTHLIGAPTVVPRTSPRRVAVEAPRPGCRFSLGTQEDWRDHEQ